MNCETLLIRHGESQYNVYLTKNLDSELTSKGIFQVKETAKYLKDNFNNLDSFKGITSHYLRCLQTSKIIHEETGINFSVNHAPRESMWSYEFVTIPERSVEYSDFKWNIPCESNYWEFKKETHEDFVMRLQSFIEQLNDNVLIVSHAEPVMLMYEIKLGIKSFSELKDYASSDLRPFVPNASMSYLREKEEIWRGKTV